MLAFYNMFTLGFGSSFLGKKEKQILIIFLIIYPALKYLDPDMFITLVAGL